VSVIIMINVGLVLFALVFVRFYENPPIEFFNAPFDTNRDVYQAGDSIIITVVYCRYTSGASERFMEIRNDKVRIIPSVSSPSDSEGCGLDHLRVGKIPEDFFAESAIIKGRSVYDICLAGFCIQREVSWVTQPFAVLKRVDN